MTNNPPPEQHLTQLFTPEELAGFGAPTEIRDTDAVSAALGGIGLGDVKAKGLPGSEDLQTPGEFDSKNAAKNIKRINEIIESLIEDSRRGRKFDDAEIADAFNLPVHQVTSSQDEWEERPHEITLLNNDLKLSGLSSAEELMLPQVIIGSLNLEGLESAQNLTLPDYIHDSLYFYSLRTMQGLMLPQHVGRSVLFRGYTTPDKNTVTSLQAYTGNVRFIYRAMLASDEIKRVKQLNPNITIERMLP